MTNIDQLLQNKEFYQKQMLNLIRRLKLCGEKQDTDAEMEKRGDELQAIKFGFKKDDKHRDASQALTFICERDKEF